MSNTSSTISNGINFEKALNLSFYFLYRTMPNPWVEILSEGAVRFHLPFTVSAEDRAEAFTEDMEKAAIFCLSNVGKERGVLFLKKPPEELLFIAKVWYPLWMVSWRSGSLLFDGLNIARHVFSYDVLPDIQTFAEELRVSSKTREAYSAFLSDRLNYFQGFKEEEERSIEGLIAPPLLPELTSYLQEAKPVKAPPMDVAVISPTFDLAAIEKALSQLSDYYEALRADIKNLRKLMKLVNDKTEEHIKLIQENLHNLKKEFDQKIADAKSSIMKKMRQIHEMYNQRITERSREFEQMLRDLHQERTKAEKARERVLIDIEQCKTEIQSSKVRKDEASETIWRKEMEKHSRELSTLEGTLKSLSKKIRETTEAKTREIASLRVEYNTEVNRAMEELRGIEASYEVKRNLLHQEMERLKNLSSTVVNQINGLLELKEMKLKELDKVGLPKKPRVPTVVYLPFYLVCYEKETKRRYVIYPPSVASGMGVFAKLKGALGAARITSLLKPRFKNLTNHLNQLIVLISNNLVFEKEIIDLCVRGNILKTKRHREQIRRGLEKLKDEEWISENDFQNLSQILTSR